ncbi:hypothetical protein BASA81_012411 [Batrachochytrium salamandrivorans]|nr:hypothetical protein BASA81_012411 [Batrachochytrium salamandrivorans]
MGNCLFCQSSGGSQCCAIWSGSTFVCLPLYVLLTPHTHTVSVVFLVFVGIVMSTPPVFVKDITDEKAVIAASNAYKVAALEGLTFLLALYMYYYRKRQETARERASLGLGSARSPAHLGEPLVSIEMNSTAGGTAASGEAVSSARSRRKKTTGGDVI